MISKLINVLQGIGLDQTPEDLADMLWLARHLDKPDLSLEKEFPIEQEDIKQPSSKAPDLPSVKDDSNASPKANLYPHTSQIKTRAGMEFNPFKAPAGYALPGKLAISRSLRPLMRKVPSRKNMILDEQATVYNIAETDTWCPVLQPDRSRWLDVVLVVDESPSMIIWYETISELKEFLERQGAFRNVQLWGFICDEEKKTICLHEGLCFDRKPQRASHPNELIDPTNRRLLLIISDCVSNSWQDGTVSKFLKPCHTNSRVSIVQMLPHYLWERTNLKNAENVYFQNISSNTVNSELEIETSPFGKQESDSNSLKLPVVTLEDRSILPWAKSLAGSANVWLPGILLYLSPNNTLEENCDKKKVPVSNKSKHNQLKVFMATASPEAQDLLRCLAALPLTLPVIRLVQRVIFPNTRQVHLAEVLLSGLIKQKELIRSNTLYNELLFDFEDGIREILIRSQPIDQTINALSVYIDTQIGIPKSFRAIVADPNLFSLSSKSNPLAPFAQIATRILRSLGGKYIDVAERIELETKNFFQKTKPVEKEKEIDLSYLPEAGKLSNYQMPVDDLFQLYKKLNVINDKIEKRIEEHIGLITDNWEAALKAGNELLWVSVTKSDKTNAMATISIWHSTNNTLMAQHMASNDKPVLSSTSLSILFNTIMERKNIKAYQDWYCKDNEIASRLYDVIVDAVGKKHYSNIMFDYLNIEKDIQTTKDKAIIIKRYESEMKQDLISIAKKSHGYIYIVAEELDQPDIELDRLNHKYISLTKNKLARKRYIWLAYYSNQPVGAIICYRGPLGFNLFFFENRCDFMVNTNEKRLKEAIVQSLIAEAKQVYFDANFDSKIKDLKYPLGYFPAVCLTSVSDVIKKMGGKLFRNYNQCYWLREGVEDYYRHLSDIYESIIKHMKAKPGL
jgi:hypothetical protein